jgi:hypothetical protein
MPDWLSAMPECGLEKMRIKPSVFEIIKYNVQRRMRRPASGLMRIWLILFGQRIVYGLWCSSVVHHPNLSRFIG